MPELVDNKTVFSLLEVTRSIQKTIADRYRRTYWIKAEMNRVNHYVHSGHAYPELVEKKNGKIVAEIRSILWKTDFERVNQQFLSILGEPLRDGITLLFEAGISYTPLYGLTLKIIDIDVSFVLGELEKEKIQSIQRLKKEGLFENNKALSFPMVPKRLAIISVETSKGLSDFFKIIHHNPWGYTFQTTLYPALLQGDNSVPSIIRQLANISERAETYDAVAIIRGGGGEVGLSSYNNYLLAKAIALSPLPVLTGIGHSTNETVSEMVAYKNAITPSELADFLIQRFHNFSVPVAQAEERIIHLVQERFNDEKQKLQGLLKQIEWSSKKSLTNARHLLSTEVRHLTFYSQRIFQTQKSVLQHDAMLIKMADPVNLLKRGFSITKHQGKVLKSSLDVQEGDLVEISLKEGVFWAKTLKP